MDKKEYEKFVLNLTHENRGEGVNRHITANPIFNVETKRKVYHVDLSEAESVIWVDTEDQEYSFDSVEEVFDHIGENHEERHKKLCDYLDQEEIALDELDESDKIDILENVLSYERIGYKEYWEYVNSHLTRTAAERFIKRKQHDYGAMRVWVGSQYLCWEFNDIIKLIMDGNLQFIED